MTAETQQGQPGGNAVATKGISFGYDPIGDITSILRYTNIAQAPSPATDAADTTLTYNNLGQLTSEDHSHNGTAIENLSWTFDTLGRVSTFSSNDGLATYGYDKASQVVSATYSGSNPPPNFSTTYDPNGVRYATGDTVGPNNHLTSDGTFNFVYDNEGNLIKRTRISSAQANDHEVDYSWDYRNRLTDAYFYNNSSVLTQHIHYVYDVFDHLIERDVDPTGGGTYTQIAHYVWDISSSAPGGDGADGSALGAGEGGVVLEFNGQQQLTNRYLNGPNTSASDSFFSTLAEEAVSSLTSPGTVTFDLNDNQGSVRNVVDANGNLLDHINYTVDGQVANESNPSVPHLTSFAGGFLDPATQMLNEYHRWLVLADAFWASADPLGLTAGDTNLTRYVGNDFTDQVDPSGLITRGTGHHLVPWSLFLGRDPVGSFTDNVIKVFNEALLQFSYDHKFDTWNGVTHDAYTKAVRAEMRAFLGGGTSTQIKAAAASLSTERAKEFVSHLLGDGCPSFVGANANNWNTITKYRKGLVRSEVVAAAALKASKDAGQEISKAEAKLLARLDDGQSVGHRLTSKFAKEFATSWSAPAAAGRAFRKLKIAGAVAGKVLAPVFALLAANRVAQAFGDDGFAAASRAAADELFMADSIEEIAKVTMAPVGKYYDTAMDTAQMNILARKIRGASRLDQIVMRRGLTGDPGYQGPYQNPLPTQPGPNDGEGVPDE